MQNFNIPEFKIRCSAIGKIMTDPRGKSVKQRLAEIQSDIEQKTLKLAGIKPELKSAENLRNQIERLKIQYSDLEPLAEAPHLSQTCISFLESWVNEHVYQRRIEVTTKYTTKGITVEDDAIVYASGYIPEMGLSSKNEQRFFNDYCHGEPDVISDDYVFDAKSSWSHDTFPLYSKEIPETDYEWQILGYMDLTGKQKGRVVFILMNMPEEMIIREAKWKLGQDYTFDEFSEFAAKYQYDTLPAFLRIKEYEIVYDPEKIEAVKKRVLECRDYINNSILPALEDNAKKYKDA